MMSNHKKSKLFFQKNRVVNK